MKSADITLPYFKQGDDLQCHLECSGDVAEALEQHAQDMDAAAKTLREIKALVAGRDVEITADGHMIIIDGEDELIDRLVQAELGEIHPNFDEECDDDSCEEACLER